jgi:hypothetical protein
MRHIDARRSRPLKNLGRSSNSQELRELIVDQVSSFVLHPMPDVVEFERSQETRKSSPHFLYRDRIEFF